MRRTTITVTLGLLLAACGGATTETTPSSTTESPVTTTTEVEPPVTATTTSAPAATTAEADVAPIVATTDDGYLLFAPIGSTTTYLVDMAGELVHTWESDYRPGNSVYLLDDGAILRTGTVPSETFTAGGLGGVVQVIEWDGTVSWEFEYSGTDGHQHHDVELLPNGNVLMIAWELVTEGEALAMGRDPDLVDADGLWMDTIVEIDPTTNEVVWIWRMSDHLVQDRDATLDTYGEAAANPHLIDLNYVARRSSPDVTHINAVDYDPATDQILLSVHSYSEIWIIDHDTTTAEAAGVAGDLVYRWGNPAAWSGDGEQILYAQHDAEWIESGLPGAGNILVFNNGDRRSRAWSSVEEISLPSTGVVAEADVVWSWDAEWFADHISGSQRLPDGSTLVSDGTTGTAYLVGSDGAELWSYVNPFATTRRNETANEVFRFEWYPATSITP